MRHSKRVQMPGILAPKAAIRRAPSTVVNDINPARFSLGRPGRAPCHWQLNSCRGFLAQGFDCRVGQRTGQQLPFSLEGAIMHCMHAPQLPAGRKNPPLSDYLAALAPGEKIELLKVARWDVVSKLFRQNDKGYIYRRGRNGRFVATAASVKELLTGLEVPTATPGVEQTPLSSDCKRSRCSRSTAIGNAQRGSKAVGYSRIAGTAAAITGAGQTDRRSRARVTAFNSVGEWSIAGCSRSTVTARALRGRGEFRNSRSIGHEV